MSDPLRIPILIGSGRRGRRSIRVARCARDRLRRAGIDAPLLDLAEFNLPIGRSAWRLKATGGLRRFRRG